jgi:dienelactone hydrolase
LAQATDVFLALLSLSACAPTPDASEPVAFCDSDRGYIYDPSSALTTWPDDWWTTEDDSTLTGLRLVLDPDDPALDAFPDNYKNVIVSLGSLDGFGTTPELLFDLSRALPDDLSTLDIVLLTQGADGEWTSHEHSVSTIDHGRTLLVRPWRPLPPASRGVLAVRAEPSDGSECITPSPTLQSLLTDPGMPLHDRYQEGLSALGWEAGDIGAMVVFTTQSAGMLDAEIIEDIDQRTPSLDGPMSCAEPSAGHRRCDGTVTVGDYRDEEAGTVLADEVVSVQEEYALPVRLWLPDDDGAAAPYPVVICGHGLAGSKSQCGFLADLAAPLGVATLAVDAVEHGEHPDRTQSGDDLDVIMAMCGFTLSPPSFDPLRLRDNFRQSAWDKLQVLRAVQSGWDADGDGSTDLDGGQVQYVGASLGGIMGPQLLAAAPELGAGILIVPGGGLMDLFIESDSFGIIAVAMTPPDWEDEDLARVVPMFQALIDAGDPLVFATQLSERRRAGDGQADLALLMAYEDTIVPNIATTRLAQALEVEIVGEALVEIPGVPRRDGSVSGNLLDGATGGLLQLDRTQPHEGAEWEDADHSTVHQSIQGADVLEPFLLTVLEGGTPELVDPYLDE